MFYCYILKSLKSGRYYIGASKDYSQRVEFHNSGRVKSTKRDRPWRPFHCEAFPSLKEARKREFQIKGWKSRKAIERLLNK